MLSDHHHERRFAEKWSKISLLAFCRVGLALVTLNFLAALGAGSKNSRIAHEHVENFFVIFCHFFCVF